MAKEKEKIDLDVLTGVGHITFNNTTFEVEPVFLDEISEFTKDGMPIPAITNEDGTPKTDKELSLFLISVFAAEDDTPQQVELKPTKSLFGGSNSTRNATSESAGNKFSKSYKKWLERKVKVEGKSIKMSDLDRLYHLTKSEIVKLAHFLYEFSGF